MRKGTIFVELRGEDRPRLERRAEEHQRSSLRDEAAYLLRWALDELDRRDAEALAPQAA